MRALRIKSSGNAVLEDAPIPALRPGHILVKVVCVALNPTDWKHIKTVDAHVSFGCDYSGVVVDVASGPTDSPKVSMPSDVSETAIIKTWRKGDRVCGVVHGGNTSHPEDGAFGEYVLALGDLQMKIPDGMSYEEAATLGMGVSTVGQGFQAMELPLPGDKKEAGTKILVYGGSSAMGSYGIKFFKSIGFEVFTTCSPKNFDYVRSLGASEAFDYNSPSCASDIRKATNDALYYAWDAIGEEDSPKICSEALSSNPASGPNGQAIYCNILFAKSPRKDVVTKDTLMYTTFGEGFKKWGKEFPASKDDKEFMKRFVASVEPLIGKGEIKPNNIEVRKGGLDGILDGLKDMKDGKISASKLVYQVGKEPEE